MPETVVVPFSGGPGLAVDLVQRLLDPTEPVVFRLPQLTNGGIRALRERRIGRLVLVGAPPSHEIGYGFAPLIALLARPNRVALVDIDEGSVVSRSLLGYLSRTAPFALGQLMASAIAIVMQRGAIALVRRAAGERGLAPELKKVLYLRPSVGSGSAVGGSVTHSHEVIRALRGEGVQVEAFTTGQDIAEVAAADPDPPCTWNVVSTPSMVKALPASAAVGGDVVLVNAALSAAKAADVIYQRHARYSLVGPLLARLTGKPLLLEYNGSEVFIGQHWNRTPLLRRLASCEEAALRAASRIFVVSQVDRRALIARGIEPGRIVFNPNGVDLTRFAKGDGSQFRRRHKLRIDDLVIGFVGTFGPWHGADVLARAFTDVAGTLPRSHLLLVGDGPGLATTANIVREAALGHRLTVTGQVPPSDVPGYLDACDILVSPHVPLAGGAEFFGSPTKVFEYMAAEKAIVASRIGQIGDVLEHGVTAWLVEPDDVRSLGEALCALACDPELRRRLGTEARLRAGDRHTWISNAQRVAVAYREMAREEHA